VRRRGNVRTATTTETAGARNKSNPELVRSPTARPRRVRRARVREFPRKVRHLTRWGSIEGRLTDGRSRWSGERRTCKKRLEATSPSAFVIEPKSNGLAINLPLRRTGSSRAGANGGWNGEIGRQTWTVEKHPGQDPVDPLAHAAGATVRRLIEVRGEVIHAVSGFRELNEAVDRRGQEAAANPRKRARRRVAPPENPAITATRPSSSGARTGGSGAHGRASKLRTALGDPAMVKGGTASRSIPSPSGSECSGAVPRRLPGVGRGESRREADYEIDAFRDSKVGTIRPSSAASPGVELTRPAGARGAQSGRRI